MYALKFDQSISTNATKSIGVNDLLKRIKTLAQELQGLEQENVDIESVKNIAPSLCNPNLLSHKNKGVSAYTACCIADVLRLCAPDAPFSQGQLKSVFECFVRQLKGLCDLEGTYFEQHFYLLESLATVESVVLLGDIHDKGDKITTELFRAFFDTAKEGQRKVTITHMVSIMSQLIDELPQLPAEVLDILLAQFMRPKTSAMQAFKLDTTARNMADAVFVNCADRLQRNVCQYFTDIIVDVTAREAQESEDDVTKKLTQLKTAHDLVLELFKSAPTTLQNVIPQLESELNVENVHCRALATESIGLMLASPNGLLIVQQYASTYKIWAGRRNDKNVNIRVKWIEGIGCILSSCTGAVRQAEVEQLCIDGLLTKFVDPDERVRSAACKVIESLDYSTAKQRLTNPVLKHYSERCRDRKVAAQEAAFGHIGKLFDWAYEDLAANDQIAVAKFGPLVNHILHCIYVNDPGLNQLLERTLFEDVFKVAELDDKKRTTRILHIVNLCDEKSRRALFALIGQNQRMSCSVLERFVQCCDKYNGGVVEQNLEQLSLLLSQLAQALSKKFPDPPAVEQLLMQFAKRNDRRIYKSILDCLKPTNDYRQIRKAVKETLKRVEVISQTLAEVFRTMLRRSAYTIFNRSIIEHVNCAARETSGLSDAAQSVLRELSKSHPALYTAHIIPMADEIKAHPLSVGRNTLKAFAQFGKSFPSDLPTDLEFCEAMEQIMSQGDIGRAKQAASILCLAGSFQDRLRTYVERIIDNLAFGSETLLVNLSAISQCTLLSPQVIEHRSNDLTAFLAKEVLTKNRSQRTESDTIEWLDDDNIEEECHAKCLAVRILGNRLRAFHAADTASEIAAPVFKALRSIVNNMGELSKADDTPLHVRSRLRLEAAKMILKLAVFPVYEKLITADDFIQIALFAQDLEYQVRKRFLARLHKSLSSRRLAPRWHTIMFLAAHDPDADIKQETKTRAVNLAAQHRSQDFLMESILPRLIHLLAHHPDFLVPDRDEEDLLAFSVYFSFYFDCVVTVDSLTLVYHYTQRIKQVADVLSEDGQNANNIYVLADIAQVVISAKAESLNWPLLAYPKRLKLPTDLYRAQASNSDVNQKQTQSFLNEQQRAAIKTRVTKTIRPLRTNTRPAVARSTTQHDIVTPKKRLSKGLNGASKRRRSGNKSLPSPPSERRLSGRTKSRVAVYSELNSDGEDDHNETGRSSDDSNDDSDSSASMG